MRRLTTKEAVDNLLRVLIHSGNKVLSKGWQGTPREASGVSNCLVEVCDLFVPMKMLEYCPLHGDAYGWDLGQHLARVVKADLPWAEDHFQERLSGSSNPGNTYLYWPYASDYTNYLKDGKFSHTYQERFWPEPIGQRYSAGNWNDVVNKLCSDPSTRQAFFSIWHPEDQANNDVRVPCTIGYWFKINNNRLDITYLIRSCDARRHLRNDIYMTQRLAHEMLRRLNMHRIETIYLGNMNMWIGSLHCFESDLYEIKKQLKNG